MKNRNTPFIQTVIGVAIIGGLSMPCDVARADEPSSSGGEHSTIIDHASDVVGDVLSTLQTYLDQIQDMRQDAKDTIGDIVGTIDHIGEVIGSLSIPDVGELVDNLWADLLDDGALAGDNDSDTPDSDPINDVNTAIYVRSSMSQLEVESTRLESDKMLSEDNQEAIATEMARMQELASSSLELAQGNANLSELSAEQVQESGSASQASASASEESSSLAQTAQAAISTQDVVKGLTAVSAQISAQMAASSEQVAGLSTQASAQSGQLANVSQQLANQTEIGAAMLHRMNQTAVGMAVMQRNLASMQEIEAGRYQGEIISDSIANNRTNQLASQAFQVYR